MTDQRRFKRFELKLPLQLRPAGAAKFETCETRNLSSGGVLFQSQTAFEVGDPVEYRITLPSTAQDAVELLCRGKVIRRSAKDTAELPQVAATLERYEFVRNK